MTAVKNLQRKQIKGMLHDWEKKYPGREENIFSSPPTVTIPQQPL